MVDGELGSGADEAAVLAGLVVAKQQVATVGTEQTPRYMDGPEEADDDHALRQTPTTERLCGLSLGALVEKGDSLLAQQDDQPSVADDIERLHRGVEQQHGHGRNSMVRRA